ncbi:MAG: hypothetical protein KAU01_07975 [Candidatus Cloacimonetes bacterium]|nr:hypothetical protein [Candidatus Cloacimonadota bacterium]
MKKEIVKSLIVKYKILGKKYFSLKKLKEDLYKQVPDFNPETLKKNLSRFKKDNILFSTGRGWYSFLPDVFELDTKPIRNIINLLNREFPLLEFNVWSTEQLLPYFHHIPTRFFTFIYAERDYLQTIYERLILKGKKVILNPSRQEAEKIFNVERDTFILRPSITEEPIENNHSKIEKVLVDLYIEKDNLQFIDEWEYERIFENIASRNSIYIDVIHYYIRRRVLFKDCPLYAILDKYCV